jgi:flagellar basal body rod protein FlgC
MRDMDLFGIAQSGMAAAEARLNVSAENIVADDPMAGIDPSGQDGAAASPHQPLQLVQFSLAGGGVGTQVEPGAGGVDLGMEMVGQMLALDQFKASVRIFEAGDQAMKTLLDLKA